MARWRVAGSLIAVTLVLCGLPLESASVAVGQDTWRVSVDSAGQQGDQDSYAPAGSSVSDDGRFVVFSSGASNLVPGDTNNVGDVFVRDRQAGVTTRVSLDSAGIQGDSASQEPTISADGRFVAFYSRARNLVRMTPI